MDSPVSRNVADKSTQPPPAQFTLASSPAYTLGQPGPYENAFVKANKSIAISSNKLPKFSFFIAHKYRLKIKKIL